MAGSGRCSCRVSGAECATGRVERQPVLQRNNGTLGLLPKWPDVRHGPNVAPSGHTDERGDDMIRTITRGLAATMLSTVVAAATAQTLADLRNDAATPGDVTTYGMGWSQQRHSPLTQIDVGHASRLQAVWNLSLDNSANASSQPLVIGGTMYVASHTH